MPRISNHKRSATAPELRKFAEHATLKGALRSIFDGMRSYEDVGVKPRQKKRAFRDWMKLAQSELRLADKALEAWLDR